MSINNHSTTTNLTGSDSDSDPDQYRIDEIIDFSQNESGKYHKKRGLILYNNCRIISYVNNNIIFSF